MSKSKIEWTQETLNVTTGCTRVSSGCDNCYAVQMTKRLAKIGHTEEKYAGLVNEGKDHFNGKVKLHPEVLEVPLRWQKPRRVFVNSMSDLFHPDVPFEFIAAVFGVMIYCKDHTFQVLTKRPDRMAEFFEWIRKGDMKKDGGESLDFDEPRKCIQFAISELDCKETILMNMTNVNGREWPAPNIWLGTSCENQQAANERIAHLLECPAAVRFLSCEPLLGEVKLTNLWGHELWDESVRYNALTGEYLVSKYQDDSCKGPKLHWVIAGGESGPDARPMHPEWVRSLRDQCQEAGVAYFFKQWGAHGPFGLNHDKTTKKDSWVFPDGKTEPADTRKNIPIEGAVLMKKVGKKTAGRQLNGREWNQTPEVEHA